MVKTRWLLLSLAIVMLLSGCASMGKGLAETVLEKTEIEDTRQSQVWGEPFTGIGADLAKKNTISVRTIAETVCETGQC